MTLTRSDDGARQSVQLPMQRAHPGIYTASPDGNGPAIAAHATTGLVSVDSPAARGEWLVLYANGLGPVTPGVPSGTAPPGLSSTVDPVSVSVGGVDAEAISPVLPPDLSASTRSISASRPVQPAAAEVPLTLTVAGIQSNVAKLSIQ